MRCSAASARWVGGGDRPDLDDFKAVNDTLGHAAGTRCCSGRRPPGNGVRPSDLRARLGGDEFVVLLEDLAGASAAQEVAARILDALRRPFRIGRYCPRRRQPGHQRERPSNDGDALLRQADGAMYQAKQAGKGRAVGPAPSSATTYDAAVRP
jgi:diguanylate cyclase (GGDEF)-like protein